MDVDLQMNLRRRWAHVKSVRKAEALRIELSRRNTQCVGTVVFNVWFACQ